VSEPPLAMRKPAPPAKPHTDPLPQVTVWPVLLLTLVLLVSCIVASAANAAEATNAPSVQTQLERELVTLVTRAEAYAAQGKYQAAYALLNAVWLLAGDPNQSPLARTVLNSLANVHYQTGQLELADRYFRELVELDTAQGDLPALSVSLFNLAHV